VHESKLPTVTYVIVGQPGGSNWASLSSIFLEVDARLQKYLELVTLSGKAKRTIADHLDH
jgi:hypothetical protein